MPNHVEQDLWVTGGTIELKQFKEFARESDERILSADKFIPYPKKFRDADEEAECIRKECQATNDWSKYTSVKDGFNSGGYEWCIQNWGTKWGIYDAVLKGEKLTGKTGKLRYRFESAWSPALKIIDAMSKQFPNLKFAVKYYECGMQFKGHYVVQNGEVLTDEEEKYYGRRGG